MNVVAPISPAVGDAYLERMSRLYQQVRSFYEHLSTLVPMKELGPPLVPVSEPEPMKAEPAFIATETAPPIVQSAVAEPKEPQFSVTADDVDLDAIINGLNIQDLDKDFSL